ncbi:MAG: hypothetical protein ABIN67_16660 [Ferruginibacter sp.]
MKDNLKVKKVILEAVDNQLRDNDPPETRQTYERLIKTGISESEAKAYIAKCISVELSNIMKNGEPFNDKRFVKNLNNLPKEPIG